MARKPKQAILTNLELGVMRVIWAAGSRALTVREVVEEINEGRSAPLAYNTVQTMLTILRDKGVVRSRSGTGRAFVYSARLSREEVTTSMVGDLVERLYDGKVRPLLQQLVEQESLTREELEDLRRRIDTQLRDDPPQGTEGHE